MAVKHKDIERYAWLDVLRFLAAVIVFYAHCFDSKENQFLMDFNDTSIVKYLFRTGGVGVCIFFLISGYIYSNYDK